MKKDFKDREESGMNLLLSYTVKEDKLAISKGYIFLGAGTDEVGEEVHVFQIKEHAKSTN